MKPQREGMIWQVLGLLVVLVAFLTIRSAEQQFTSIFNQKYAGWMDVVWPFAIGLFAAFLLLAGAAAIMLQKLPAPQRKDSDGALREIACVE